MGTGGYSHTQHNSPSAAASANVWSAMQWMDGWKRSRQASKGVSGRPHAPPVPYTAIVVCVCVCVGVISLPERDCLGPAVEIDQRCIVRFSSGAAGSMASGQILPAGVCVCCPSFAGRYRRLWTALAACHWSGAPLESGRREERRAGRSRCNKASDGGWPGRTGLSMTSRLRGGQVRLAG